MRVLFLTLGGRDEACTRTRVFAMLPYLRRANVGYRIVRFAGGWRPPAGALGRWSRERQRERANTVVKALRLAQLAPRFDLVVVQRVLFAEPLQRLLRARSRALAFDFDDAIYAPPGDPAFAEREARRFDAMIARCNGVIASTPHLAARARRTAKRVDELITPVDTERYRPVSHVGGERAVVGWIGSPSTGPYLDAIRPALAAVLRGHPAVRVEVIGAPRALAGLDGVEHARWSYDGELPRLQRFDIGLMPLPDDEWTRGKGGYKLLQYMAVGAAAVASPVGVNATIVRDGVNGLLAHTEAEWIGALGRLIDDAPLRRRLGNEGRRSADATYSLRQLGPRFVDAYRSIAGAGTA